jgi:hypothetical protein
LLFSGQLPGSLLSELLVAMPTSCGLVIEVVTTVDVMELHPSARLLRNHAMDISTQPTAQMSSCGYVDPART